MCGFTGIIAAGPVELDLVRRMSDAIAHRGPDDAGAWRDSTARVALGHRRLSIIDLSPAGHQPMTSPSGRWTVAYNGEIYNHLDLRRELAAAEKAPAWRGHSDTETLLAAVEVWGVEGAVGRSVGMFAFALWDKAERRLTLCRDRFGEKPLYYGWCGTDFVFGSELKALRVHPRFDDAIEPAAVAALAARSYVPAPLSINRSVYKLEPGCLLTIALDAASSPITQAPRAPFAMPGFAIHRYWNYADVVLRGLDAPFADEADAMNGVLAAIDRAIDQQAVADVPVGAFLSGGIDSSFIVARFQARASRPIRTFTLGFDEEGFDEAAYAREVAAHLCTHHTELYVTPEETREIIPQLPTIYDEPFADSSQIPTFIVSRLARQDVTVSLSGDGGDELFGGYNRYFGVAPLWGRFEKLPARTLFAKGLSAVPEQLWTRGASLASRKKYSHNFGVKVKRTFETLARSNDFQSFFDRFLDDWGAHGAPLAAGAIAFPPYPALPRSVAAATRMMHADAVRYLPDDILTKVDRAAMAVSLETRVPFLDHRVAEAAARVPLSLKVGGGKGKLILRKLLARDVPARLFERPKAGFGIPIAFWLRGPLRDWAEELLSQKRLVEDGWFDAAAVRLRWEAHLAGREDATSAIWSVLMFQAWRETQRAALPKRAAA